MPTKREILVEVANVAGGIIFGIIAFALDEAGFRFLSFVAGFLAVSFGLLVIAHFIETLGVKYVKTGLVVVLIFTAGLFGFLAFHEPPPEPKPHFTLSLQIEGSSIFRIALTNDCFFRVGLVNVIHSTNDFLLFNGIANGCIVIPVLPEESNKVFSFIAENDSPVKVNDLSLAVGFLKEWKLGLDSTKWHEAGEHFMLAGWRLDVTNFQFWAAQSPWTLFPWDSVAFPPITNSSIPEFNNPTNQIGGFRLIVSATDFREQLTANILFVRVPSKAIVKPFITTLHLGPDGIWRISVSQKEIDDSQK